MRVENNIEVLKDILLDRIMALEEVREFLNEAGEARLEASKTIYYHSSFCDSLEELVEWEDYINLFNIPGKHPEYYKALREIDRGIKYALRTTDDKIEG